MASAENKYLRRRGGVWFFQRRIPRAAQKFYGVVTLNRSLGTGDVEVARVRRDEMIAHLVNQRDLEPLFAAWQAEDLAGIEAASDVELRDQFGHGEEADEGEYDRRVGRLMTKILHLSSSLETVHTSLTRFSVDLNNVELAYHNLACRVAQISEMNPKKQRQVS